MAETYITLPAIKETTADFENLERRVKEIFRIFVYYPILDELDEPKRALTNAMDEFKALRDALFLGRVTFYRGTFSGRFNASVSRELKELGARWDRKTSTFKILQSSLPTEVQTAIAASESRFKQKLSEIDRKLEKILPENISEKLKAEDLFDRTLWKTDRAFRESVKHVTVAPELTVSARKKIASEWQNNMRLYIKDFAEKEIKELRQSIQKSVFAGDRYGSAVKSIKKSYGVTEGKAKFLARQETSLLMTKFKETRYLDAGIKEYTWHSVAGSKNHPVRPQHKALADASKKGKIFRWDDPPITSEPGQPVRRNNPGQDYNCRCFAQPVVRFKK